MGRSVVDLIFEPAGAATTIVLFHAALRRDAYPSPHFTGFNLTGGAPVNRVFVADPVLYDDEGLDLAWYAGADGLPLQPALLRIIEHLHHTAGGTRLATFGASGGGFAAMYYANHLPGALAIAVNPQTNIARYVQRSVRRYLEVAWDRGDEPDLEQALAAVDFDLTTTYDGRASDLLYIQNTGDRHRDQHLRPFVEKLDDKDRTWILERAWGEGHVAVPPAELKEIVQLVLNEPGPWAQVLRNVGTRGPWWRMGRREQPVLPLVPAARWS
ncbi:hypothetical protein ACFT5B_04255 [Luteimicrobium sp. NPDC057192]|uniref:hypothetical protein n=1 Tax=Luteimicrobium sp. NPDC057192 TaxID=3346042 RepID=UPI0036320E06